MDKYEILLKDLKEILETIGEVNYVSHGKITPLDAEDQFTAVYISPDTDTFTSTKIGTGISSYTNVFYINLTVNMDCSDDDLLWLTTRRSIMNAILGDTAIWTNIIDRDIVGVAYDEYGNYPRRAMMLTFKFKIREDCVV